MRGVNLIFDAPGGGMATLRSDVGMTLATSASAAGIRETAALARRFEAIVFDWDGTAVPDRRADATPIRRLVEQASVRALELAVVSGTHVGNIDGQLRARPAGPGNLTLALNRGLETFCVDRDRPRLAYRRTATADEAAAVSRAARLTVERLAARGLVTRIVSERLNRRKIDLIPEAEWDDPPKARIGELLAALENRLAAAGIGGLPEAVEIVVPPPRRQVWPIRGDQRRQARRDRPDR
jgi:hypothetical protein